MDFLFKAICTLQRAIFQTTSMIKLLTIFLAFCISAGVLANTSYQVNYINQSNGENIPNSASSFVFVDNVAYLSAKEEKTQSFIDFTKRSLVTTILFNQKVFENSISFDSLPLPTLTNETENILHFTCKKAVYKSFSNTIEVWYTEKAKAKGSIYAKFLPSENALVLKVVINGNRGIIATSIKKLKDESLAEYPPINAMAISLAELEELKIKSRYTILEVFKNEKINFDTSLKIPELHQAELDKTYRLSNGTIVLKKIKLPQLTKEGCYTYAHLECWSEGDAYDRTGSIFILPTNAEKQTFLAALEYGIDTLPVFVDHHKNEYQGYISNSEYEAPTEVMRFFTSFGADYFNKRREINNYNWKNAAHYKQEITALIPDNEDEIWIGVFIGNYSKDGHRINLNLDFYPGFENPDNKQKLILPLFCTVNLKEASGQNYPRLFRNDTLTVAFTIPENSKDVSLLFTSTGHGGWGGGDEFNPKLNEVFIDDELVYSIVPWRTDCATYRLYNPASGNFSNGMSSSDLSRSNWCPATVTPPYIIPLQNIKPGKHILKVAIDQGEDEGGSFSHWGVSGIIVGNKIIQKP